MDIERLKEHDLHVLRGVVGRLEEEQSIDPAIARQFEQVIDEAIARQSVTSEDCWKGLREEFMDNLRGCDTVTISLSGIGSTDYSTQDIHNMMMALEDRVVAKSATSEEVQIEINRLQESLNQTKEAAKELKEQKYTVNMLPVYNQIKSLELQITALQAYQPWIPVSERLPENYQNVLVARNFKDNPNNFMLCSFASFVNGNWYEERKKRTTVTHWKPLPEPPKGE